MTGRKVGSVCEASSSMLFSEDLPCGMSKAEDMREVCLRWLLSASLDFQKGLEKIVL